MTEEQSLIEAARRGNDDAWVKLVSDHQQSVFRLAYLFLGDADDAEDISQETFIRAYRSLNRFDASRPLRPWLLRITTNLCHNWRRSLGRYLAVLQRNLRNQPELLVTTTLAETNLGAQDLWRKVNSLSAQDQQIIFLRYFLDCSEAETSTVLGIARGTAKSRTHRALGRLKKLLLNDQPEYIKESNDGF